MPRSAIGYPLTAEWLEADGLGGFASGTIGGARTRRYHALLLTATSPPTGRVVMVNGLEAWVETDGDRFPITTHRYAPDVLHPDGAQRLVRFRPEPWPRWVFRLGGEVELAQEIVAVHGRSEVVLRWRLGGRTGPARLLVRLLMSGRDYHGLHHENAAFAFTPRLVDGAATWRPYPGLPAVTVRHNGAYRHEPLWYRDFLYLHERERGLDDLEDLASPGSFTFDLAGGEAVLVLRAGEDDHEPVPAAMHARDALKLERRRRQAFASPLHRAAEAYIVRRGAGRTVLAGYPWFTDWGRDTFITLRGLLTTPGGPALARDILLPWAATESRGMLPNRFPDSGEAPEFNSVDAALWFVVACHDYLQATAGGGPDASTLRAAIARILGGYRRGSRHGIRADGDGLLAAGEPGLQLTWMDVKIGDRVITPRIGKPVEVQALWLNALKIGEDELDDGPELHRRAMAAFRSRFWNEERGYLLDVADADHVPGQDDATFRPNQILAVGGLPFPLLDGPEAGRVVQAVEERLLTPLGLRSLAPGEPGYRPRYEGGVVERDSAYHQGTVWPWLMGPFVEAWLRVRGASPAARREAKARFVDPLLSHLDQAGLGHLCEIADAEPPHLPRGCPFQAWSMGELLRMLSLVRTEEPTVPGPPAGRS